MSTTITRSKITVDEVDTPLVVADTVNTPSVTTDTISTDTVIEKTTDNGVSVEGVKNKDGYQRRKKYIGGTDYTITGQAGFSLVGSVAFVDQDLDDDWWIVFFANFTQSSCAQFTITISGITFQTGVKQAGTCYLNSVSSVVNRSQAAGGDGILVVQGGAVGTEASVYIKARLDSKPPWVI